MLKRCAIFALCLLIILAGKPSSSPAHAQDDGCDKIVQDALSVIGTSCARIGKNEACYGHTLVEATFQPDATAALFATKGDTAQLIDLEALTTEPADPVADVWGVAVLKVQADLPDDGESVMTFVLFGDAQITSDRTNAPSLPMITVKNAGKGNMTLRAGPGKDRPLVAILPAGSEAQADARNESGDWLRLDYEGSRGWAQVSKLDVQGSIDSLTVLNDQDATISRYDQPMQAFVLRSGSSGACEAAPDGLLIQSPAGQRAHVMVNGVSLEFSSTGFLTAQPDGDLMISGLEGRITVTAQRETVTVLPGYQTTVALDGLSAAAPPTDPAAFQNDQLPLALLPEAAPAQAGSEPSDSSMVCSVTPISGAVNLRSGPSTDYPVQGQLNSGQTEIAAGQATGADGVVWWTLSGGQWVRSDVVTAAGPCEGMPVATAPEMPTPEAAIPDTDPASYGTAMIVLSGPGVCTGGVPTSRTATYFQMGTGAWATMDEAIAGRDTATYSMTIDGQPVPVTLSPAYQKENGTYGFHLAYYWNNPPAGTHTVTASNTTSCCGTAEATCTINVVP